MKKLLFVVAVLDVFTVGVQAQTFDEWFNQKKTEIKYYLAQIALYEQYMTDVEKGISVAKKGLDFIEAMKKGEFDLHNLFFASLKSVNPEIAKYSKVADILSCQQSILRKFNRFTQQIQQSNLFTVQELNYVAGVFSNLMTECAKTLGDLVDVVTNNRLQMTDDERMARIDSIYTNMRDKYSFAQAFTAEGGVMIASRLSEQGEVGTLQSYFNLK